MDELKNQLARVEIAGELLEKAPVHKTKKAAALVGKETLKLLKLSVDVISQQNKEIEQLKERIQ